MKSIFRVFPYFFILLPINGFSQFGIREKIYKLSYYDNNNCTVYDYSFTIPVIEGNDKINDSIARIAKEQWNWYNEGICSPEFFSRNEDCDGVSLNPGYVGIEYQLGQNRKDFLSFKLLVTYQSGGGGNGKGMDIYCFNINSNNQPIMLDSLFDQKEQKKLSKLVREISVNEEGYDVFEYSTQFEGYHITDTALVMHYNAGGTNNFIYDIPVPLNKLKDLINKKYKFLLN